MLKTLMGKVDNIQYQRGTSDERWKLQKRTNEMLHMKNKVTKKSQTQNSIPIENNFQR